MSDHGDTRWERWLRNVAGLAFWTMFAVGAVGAAQSCMGCGGNDALKLHAAGAVSMRTVLDGAADTIEMERERAQAEAVQEARDADTARARVALIREEWALVLEGHALAVAAWQTWVDALVLASATDDAEGLHFLARTLAGVVRAYARVAELVIDAGGPRLPAVPDAIAALVGEL
jgi:hypothetical protein